MRATSRACFGEAAKRDSTSRINLSRIARQPARNLVSHSRILAVLETQKIALRGSRRIRRSGARLKRGCARNTGGRFRKLAATGDLSLHASFAPACPCLLTFQDPPRVRGHRWSWCASAQRARALDPLTAEKGIRPNWAAPLVLMQRWATFDQRRGKTPLRAPATDGLGR